MALTPVALAQGMYLSHHWFGNSKPADLNLANVPTAVFSQPSFAYVGMTEEQAIERKKPFDVYTTRFKHMKFSFSDKSQAETTLMKVIVDIATDKVLGIHVVSSDAAEIVQGIAVAMNAGLTKQTLDQTIGIHPSAAEELVTLRNVTRRVESFPEKINEKKGIQHGQ